MRQEKDVVITITDCMTGDNLYTLRYKWPLSYFTVEKVVNDCLYYDFSQNQHGIHITYGIE